MAETFYAWDPVFDCILDETDASGAVVAEYTQEPRPYGGLISQKRGGTTSYYHYDPIGTTRALTNQAQTVSDRTTYSAFGELIDSTGVTVNPFGYVGEMGYAIDKAVGICQVRSRHYDPRSARWNSLDPIGFQDGLNIYNYSRNSPLKYVDPSGHKCVVLSLRTVDKGNIDSYDAGLFNLMAFGAPFPAPIHRQGVTDRVSYLESLLWNYLFRKPDPDPKKPLPKIPVFPGIHFGPFDRPVNYGQVHVGPYPYDLRWDPDRSSDFFTMNFACFAIEVEYCGRDCRFSWIEVDTTHRFTLQPNGKYNEKLERTGEDYPLVDALPGHRLVLAAYRAKPKVKCSRLAVITDCPGSPSGLFQYIVQTTRARLLVHEGVFKPGVTPYARIRYEFTLSGGPPNNKSFELRYIDSHTLGKSADCCE